MSNRSLVPATIALGLSALLVAACGVERNTEERVEDRAEELVEDQVESDRTSDES